MKKENVYSFLLRKVLMYPVMLSTKFYVQGCHQIREFRDSQGILFSIRKNPGKMRDFLEIQGKSGNYLVFHCFVSKQSVCNIINLLDAFILKRSSVLSRSQKLKDKNKFEATLYIGAFPPGWLLVYMSYQFFTLWIDHILITCY